MYYISAFRAGTELFALPLITAICAMPRQDDFSFVGINVFAIHICPTFTWSPGFRPASVIWITTDILLLFRRRTEAIRPSLECSLKDDRLQWSMQYFRFGRHFSGRDSPTVLTLIRKTFRTVLAGTDGRFRHLSRTLVAARFGIAHGTAYTSFLLPNSDRELASMCTLLLSEHLAGAGLSDCPVASELLSDHPDQSAFGESWAFVQFRIAYPLPGLVSVSSASRQTGDQLYLAASTFSLGPLPVKGIFTGSLDTQIHCRCDCNIFDVPRLSDNLFALMSMYPSLGGQE